MDILEPDTVDIRAKKITKQIYFIVIKIVRHKDPKCVYTKPQCFKIPETKTELKRQREKSKLY